ncbi:hypothetical protein H0H93_012481 [Arthromyces matolae]|nr:hypothetical protein H0H93_012481 [Arthromyces matolae]
MKDYRNESVASHVSISLKSAIPNLPPPADDAEDEDVVLICPAGPSLEALNPDLNLDVEKDSSSASSSFRSSTPAPAHFLLWRNSEKIVGFDLINELPIPLLPIGLFYRPVYGFNSSHS